MFQWFNLKQELRSWNNNITRWLNNKSFCPKELWQIVKKDVLIKRETLILVVDDSVLAKLFSKKIELVNYQYSGTKHDVKASDGESKNIHFRDMLSLAKLRGLNPKTIVKDTWYPSLNNLKTIRSHDWT